MAEILFDSVRDTRLHEEVSRQIARRIILGELPSGAALPAEAELLMRFGVSRPVIREALRALAESGLIIVRHGRRTVVAPQGEWDVLSRLTLTAYRDADQIGPLLRDSVGLRQLLEPALAAQAARQRSPDLLLALAASLARQEATLDQPDVFLEEDITFHNLLAAADGNRIVMRILATLSELLHVSREVTNALPNALPGAIQSHRYIYDAVRDGDPERAYEMMQRHLARNRDAVGL